MREASGSPVGMAPPQPPPSVNKTLIITFIDSPVGKDYGLSITGFLQSLNVITVWYLLVPALMMVVSLSHQIAWPVLSWVSYPLIRYKVITNRKALIAFGTFAVTFALNLERVGIRNILKMVS